MPNSRRERAWARMLHGFGNPRSAVIPQAGESANGDYLGRMPAERAGAQPPSDGRLVDERTLAWASVRECHLKPAASVAAYGHIETP
jgi:hypothetical protein